MTHADIIASIGTAVIAAALDVPAAHVRVWKNRRIPRSMYAELIDAFPQVTLEMLKAGEPGASIDEHVAAPASDGRNVAPGNDLGAEKNAGDFSPEGVAA